MKILFIAGREPGYARNRVILKGLRKNNIEVVECTSNAKNFVFRIWSALLQFLCTSRKDIDAILVGFFGQPIVLKIRPFTRKPIIFDAFLSGYDTMVFGKKKLKEKSLFAQFFLWMDRVSCKWANVVLVDTPQHKAYFIEKIKVPKNKIDFMWIGADEDLFKPLPKPENKKYIVSFHGNFIPISGVRFLVNAAHQLRNENIHFQLIGNGQTLASDKKLAHQWGLKNITFHGQVPIEEIPSHVAKADICIGLLDKADKIDRVIPIKSFEVAAMKKPLITVESPAVKELFKNNESVLFCKPADPASLAQSILKLKNNKELASKIATNAYNMYQRECTTKAIGEKLHKIIQTFLKKP